MLSLKHVAINSFNENIVYLHRDCDIYKVEDIKNVTKIEVHGGAEPVGAFLEVVDDESIVSPNQLGVNNQAFEQLNLPEGANVTVSLATVPSSVASIKRKISVFAFGSLPDKTCQNVSDSLASFFCELQTFE